MWWVWWILDDDDDDDDDDDAGDDDDDEEEEEDEGWVDDGKNPFSAISLDFKDPVKKVTMNIELFRLEAGSYP